MILDKKNEYDCEQCNFYISAVLNLILTLLCKRMFSEIHVYQFTGVICKKILKIL